MATWTHLIRFVAIEDDLVHLGHLIDTTRDIGLDTISNVPVQAHLVEGSIFDVRVTNSILTVKNLLSPITKEQCTYIRCIGMNYADHAKVCRIIPAQVLLTSSQEIEIDLPDSPSMFTKPRTALADPFPASLSVPRLSQEGSSDYEAELCVIIGKEGRNISKDKALDYILGYTAANDVSSRKLQMADQQWSFSKGFDGSCPIGMYTSLYFICVALSGHDGLLSNSEIRACACFTDNNFGSSEVERAGNLQRHNRPGWQHKVWKDEGLMLVD